MNATGNDKPESASFAADSRSSPLCDGLSLRLNWRLIRSFRRPRNVAMSSPPPVLPPPVLPPTRPAGSSGLGWIVVFHVVVFATASVFLLKLVPAFTKVFAERRADLPGMTLLLIDISNWWKDNWFVLPVVGLPAYAVLMWLVRANRPALRVLTYGVFACLLLLLAFGGVALYLPLVPAGPQQL